MLSAWKKDRGGEYRCSKGRAGSNRSSKIEICNPRMLRSTKEADRKNDTNDEVDKPLRKEKRLHGTGGWISRKISLDETSIRLT